MIVDAVVSLHKSPTLTPALLVAHRRNARKVSMRHRHLDLRESDGPIQIGPEIGPGHARHVPWPSRSRTSGQVLAIPGHRQELRLSPILPPALKGNAPQSRLGKPFCGAGVRTGARGWGHPRYKPPKGRRRGRRVFSCPEKAGRSARLLNSVLAGLGRAPNFSAARIAPRFPPTAPKGR